MAEKIPRGFKLECSELRGKLGLSPLRRNVELDIREEDQPYDDLLRDNIAAVEYTEIDKALEKFGVDTVKRVLAGETPNVKTSVCVFKRKEFQP